jgi:hypothetical protein
MEDKFVTLVHFPKGEVKRNFTGLDYRGDKMTVMFNFFQKLFSFCHTDVDKNEVIPRVG